MHKKQVYKFLFPSKNDFNRYAPLCECLYGQVRYLCRNLSVDIDIKYKMGKFTLFAFNVYNTGIIRSFLTYLSICSVHVPRVAFVVIL